MEESNHIKMLIDEKQKKYLVKVTGEFEIVQDLGVIDTSRLIAKKNGEKIEVNGHSFWIAEPGTEDMFSFLSRSAQIIAAKDIASILFKCNVRPGSLVVEGGAGSGFMSIALLNSVRPTGKLVSYELRKDFAELARKNIEMVGLDKYWILKLEDVSNISEKEVDSVVIDIPEPWKAVRAIYSALKNSGWMAVYVPTVSQVEQTFRSLKENNFESIEVKEILERRWVIGELGSRPETQMLGHTGFLVFARKI